jgi:hypothetical protein
LDEVKGSLLTNEGVDAEKYDFDFYLNEPEKPFLGFGGSNLRFVGKGKF